MLRKSSNSRHAKPDYKRQKSQQFKTIKGRKNDSSPIYKEIMINKQNIHPNTHKPTLHAYSDSNNQPNFSGNNSNLAMYKNKHINMSPTSFSNVNIGNYKFNCYNSANTHGNSTANGSAKANPVAIASTNANMSSQLDDTQFRDKYFQLKQCKYSKLQNTKPHLSSKGNQIQQLQPHKLNVLAKRKQQEYISLYNRLLKQHRQGSKQKDRQLKITNHSLQKCQIHPPSISLCSKSMSSPKAQFIINEQDRQILCCEQCAVSRMNKNSDMIATKNFNQPKPNNAHVSIPIPLDRITNTYIGGGLTISQYFKILNDRFDNLQKVRKNIEKYEKQYKAMSARQLKKHIKYYNDILQIIQVSMKESESTITRHITQGQRIIKQKKQAIDDQLKFTKQQIKTLLDFQQKQYKYNLSPIHNRTDFHFSRVLTNKQYQLQIGLPVIQLYIEMPDVRQSFTKIFQQKFALKLLSSEELNARVQQNKQMEPNHKLDNYQSYQSSNQTYQRTQCRQSQQPDLFCDEQIGQSRSNRTRQFSFDKSNEEQMLIKNNDCILQLVEEEDVISPVFKVI